MILNLMEGYDVAALGHNSADALHLFAEAKKLVWADRDTYVADADANPLPTAPAHLEALRGGAAQADSTPSGPRPPSRPAGRSSRARPSTSPWSTRTATPVSLIESIFGSFGSKVVARRRRLRPAESGQRVHAGGRPPQRARAAQALAAHQHARLRDPATASPSSRSASWAGPMQPQGHWQVLSNMIDFGMNLQEAGDAARLRHSPSYQPGGTLAVEPGIPDARRRRTAAPRPPRRARWRAAAWAATRRS